MNNPTWQASEPLSTRGLRRLDFPRSDDPVTQPPPPRPSAVYGASGAKGRQLYGSSPATGGASPPGSVSGPDLQLDQQAKQQQQLQQQQLPWALGAPAGAPEQQQRVEEREFAAVLAASMRGEIEPADALLQYAAICRRRAGELRGSAGAQQLRAARYLALREAAEHLDAESATWALMWHLHGVPSSDFPGGKGGDFVEGAGFAKAWRQRAADLLYQDAVLNRCSIMCA